MKKNLCGLLLIALLLVSCVTKQDQPDTPPVNKKEPLTRWDKIVENGELKIGVNTLDDSFDNDLINEFSKESKLTVKRVLVGDEEKSQLLNNDMVDFLWSQIPDSSENSVQYSLSKPYFNCSILIVSKNNLQPSELSTVGALENSAEYEIALREEKKTVKTAKDIETLLNMLSDSSVEAVYINKEAYDNSKTQKDEFLTIKDFDCNFVLAFKHNDKDVKTEVEKIMAKIKANGTATSISEKWYNKDFIIK